MLPREAKNTCRGVATLTDIPWSIQPLTIHGKWHGQIPRRENMPRWSDHETRRRVSINHWPI